MIGVPFGRVLPWRASGRGRWAAVGALAEVRDELACQARYWARLAEQEEQQDSLRRTCMAVKAHAFAQAAVHADEVLGRAMER
ncbi:hypothetical protein E1293_34830 [Actinomadura darangshiensis]|uniref:Uncharacterized protein n=1 Tax=Actinomadura darangshiensis TaxID=705336 RepID=A0A4R5AD46_9ACTN|nr:hypothetical protein [Actinomadura darangshiensis]TDD70343.1 hypothetical protein E1293_34830 [Actinomadura darangshiensis]